MRSLGRPTHRAWIAERGVRRVVALVVLSEFVLRAGLGWHSFLAVLLFPPILGVALFRGLARARSEVDVDTNVTVRSAFAHARAGFRRSAAIATGTHVVAVTLGTALVLVVDTPLRYLYYALTDSELVPFAVLLLVPTFGVAVATLVWWGLFLPALFHGADGGSDGIGLHHVLRFPLVAPRVALAGATSMSAVALVLGFGIGIEYMFQWSTQFAPRWLWLVSGERPVVLFAFLVAPLLPIPVIVGSVSVPVLRRVGRDLPAAPTVDRRRVVVAIVLVLLLSSAVVTAGAIRMTETRPVDNAPAPLPEDPGAAYAVAIDNAERTSHAYSVTNGREDDRTTFRASIDRENRRIRTRWSGAGVLNQYGSAGTSQPSLENEDGYLDRWQFSNGTWTDNAGGAYPGYWSRTSRYDLTSGGEFGLPESGTGSWKAVDRSDGSLTVELTDDEAVMEAIFGAHDDEYVVEEAWIRMTIDTERRVPTSGEAILSFGGAPDENATVETRYEYAVDVDEPVERPTDLHAPTLGEWLWKLFAY